MKKKMFQIKATREAGMVRRCHTLPHHGQYNIAQHSYGAVSLLLLLNRNPSLSLIKAVMWHDVGERWMGDIPSPAKKSNPQLRQFYEEVERRVLATLGLLPGLMPDEQNWLKAVDILDLWFWCREEEALGNTAIQEMSQNCYESLYGLRDQGRLPIEVDDFLHYIENRPQGRLSDFFDEAVRLELEETEP